MRLAAVFALLVSSVICSSVISSSSSVKDCTRKLEEIVYSPNGQYKDYLIGISKELKPLAFIYDSPQGRDFVYNFVNRYQTYVKVRDAMGNSYTYNTLSNTPTYVAANSFTNADARADMNLGAYLNGKDSYSYSFLSFNCQTGVMYEVTVGILKTAPHVDGSPSPNPNYT